jgi:eukaryotic-like serine/threonine-protein kinase
MKLISISILLLIISTVVVVSNSSIAVPNQQTAMAQTGATTVTTNSTTADAALLTYTNSTAGIKIQYPSNWQPQSPDNPFDTLRFVSPAGGILGIQVSDIPMDVSLAQEATAGVNMLSKSFNNFSLVSSTPATIAGGNPAQRIEYTAREGQLDLRFIQVVTIKDGKEYILTFGAPKDQFSSDLPAVQQIVD